MPAGEVRARDVADLAGGHEIVERRKRFLDRGSRVESVHVVDVDGIRAEAAQAILAGADQVTARRSQVVRAVTYGESSLGGDQQPLALARNRFTQDFFRESFGVDIGRVKKINSRVQTNI